MKKIFTITFLAYILLISASLLGLWFLVFGQYFQGDIKHPDPGKAKDIQPFISGLVLPLLTLGSTLLVVANLRSNTIQNFSNNFFKLIDQHHKLVDNIVTVVEGISTGRKPSAKRDFFDDLATRIARDYECIASGDEEKTKQMDKVLIQHTNGTSGKELLMCIYDHYFHVHLSDLGHYFRNLYHIVMFAERSSINTNLKVEFIKMLRAQLSNYEILLLAYNGLHEYGKGFFPLIDKYELLKNLNEEDKLPESYDKRIIDPTVLMGSYPHLAKCWNKKLASTKNDATTSKEK